MNNTHRNQGVLYKPSSLDATPRLQTLNPTLPLKTVETNVWTP